jgi:hypothetical protein
MEAGEYTGVIGKTISDELLAQYQKYQPLFFSCLPDDMVLRL